jgi:hypothetical protein
VPKCDLCGDESNSPPDLMCGRVEYDDQAEPITSPCKGTYRDRTHMTDTIPRRCFYIPADAYVEGKGFVPSLVTENEPGHSPLTGNGEFAAPWYWGNTYEEAKALADSENAKKGLTADDVATIIASSMFPTT